MSVPLVEVSFEGLFHFVHVSFWNCCAEATACRHLFLFLQEIGLRDSTPTIQETTFSSLSSAAFDLDVDSALLPRNLSRLYPFATAGPKLNLNLR